MITPCLVVAVSHALHDFKIELLCNNFASCSIAESKQDAQLVQAL